MRIGLKYCGGCNTYYDRKKAVGILQAKMQNHIFKPYSANEEWDAVILVCGCASACTKVHEPETKKIYITAQEDIDMVLDSLAMDDGDKIDGLEEIL